MKKNFNERSYLNQKFSDLGIGWHEDIEGLSNDELDALIVEIQSLLDKYSDGIESNDFIDELAVLVNSYTKEG